MPKLYALYSTLKIGTVDKLLEANRQHADELTDIKEKLSEMEELKSTNGHNLRTFKNIRENQIIKIIKIIITNYI